MDCIYITSWYTVPTISSYRICLNTAVKLRKPASWCSVPGPSLYGHPRRCPKPDEQEDGKRARSAANTLLKTSLGGALITSCLHRVTKSESNVLFNVPWLVKALCFFFFLNVPRSRKFVYSTSESQNMWRKCFKTCLLQLNLQNLKYRSNTFLYNFFSHTINVRQFNLFAPV